MNMSLMNRVFVLFCAAGACMVATGCVGTADWKNQNAVFEKKISDLSAQAKENEKKLDALKKQLDGIGKQLAEIPKVMDMKARLATAETSLVQNNATMGGVTKSVGEMTEKLTALTEKVDKAATIKSLEKLASGTNNELTALKKKDIQLDIKDNALAGKIKTNSEVVATVVQKLTRVEMLIAKFDEEARKLQEGIAISLKGLADVFRSEHGTLDGRKKTLKTAIDFLDSLVKPAASTDTVKPPVTPEVKQKNGK